MVSDRQKAHAQPLTGLCLAAGADTHPRTAAGSLRAAAPASAWLLLSQPLLVKACKGWQQHATWDKQVICSRFPPECQLCFNCWAHLESRHEEHVQFPALCAGMLAAVCLLTGTPMGSNQI